MPIPAAIKSRFDQLLAAGAAIESGKKTIGGSVGGGVVSIPTTVVDQDRAEQWSISAVTLLRSACTEGSDHYRLAKAELGTPSLHKSFRRIHACLKAALDDLENGGLFDAKAMLEAEVCGDLLGQAEALLAAGYKDPAAVLAGGVLEQHLRALCNRHGVSLTKPNGSPRAINDMNDELAKAGAYNAMRKKEVTYLADLRNKAAHGQYAQYTAADIEALIRHVTAFCAAGV